MDKKYLSYKKEAKKIKSEMETIVKKLKKLTKVAKLHKCKLAKVVNKDIAIYHAPEDIIDSWLEIETLQYSIINGAHVADIFFEDWIK